MAEPLPHTETSVLTVRPDCDLCAQEGRRFPAAVDGATRMGPWAYMCEPHFEQYGLGFGPGSRTAAHR